MKSFFRNICNYWTYVYILVMMIGLPLYVEDNYFNIIQAKSRFFIIVAGIILFIGIILFSFFHRKQKKWISAIDIAVLSFTIITIISCLFSGNINNSFWGSSGWGVGTYTWICLALSYFLISRCHIYNPHICIPIIAVNSVIILFAILQACGIDVFQMHLHMFTSQIYGYFSTIGNSNWWVGYICLLSPVTAVFILNSNSTVKYILLNIFWFFICAAMLIIGSDGLFIGLGLCSLFAIPYSFKSIRFFKRTLILILIFGLCMFPYTTLDCFKERISSINTGIFNRFLNPLYSIIIVLISICGLLFINILNQINNKYPASIHKAKTVAIFILEILIISIIIFFAIDAALNFNDDWGTRRGLIWRISSEILSAYNVKSLLIGIGPDLLYEVYNTLSATFGQTVLNAHSEPLQYLMTTGILGLASWSSIWISSIAVHYRSKRNLRLAGKQYDNYHETAFYLSLISYLGQSFVNSGTPGNLAILFIFLGLFSSFSRQKFYSGK